MNVIQIGSWVIHTQYSRERDPRDSPSLWRFVVSAYRCHFLFSFVIIHLEALENHYRLITIVTV